MNPTHEAEVSLLGSVMLNNQVLGRCADIVSIGSLADHRHRLIFAGMLRLEGKGEPIDAVTLAASLEADGSIAQAGGLAYLIELTGASATSVNVEHHARVVAEGAKRRGLYEAFSAAARGVIDITTPTDETLSTLESAMSALVYQDRKSSAGVNTPDAARGLALELQSIMDGSATPAISTGLKALDAAMLGGIRPGKQYVIGAPTGVGKTALAHYIASRVVANGPGAVLYFSVEVPAIDLQTREISKISGVPGDLIMQPHAMSEHQMDAVGMALKQSRSLGRDGIVVYYEPGFSAEFVMRKAREYQRRGSIALVVADYIGAMTTGTKCDNKTLEIEHISQGLMNVSASLGVPVLTLSQFTKKIDERPSKVPIVGDLFYGSGLANNADVIMLLDRPDYWDVSDESSTANIWIRKNRTGPIGRVAVAHTAYNGRFWDHQGDM